MQQVSAKVQRSGRAHFPFLASSQFLLVVWMGRTQDSRLAAHEAPFPCVEQQKPRQPFGCL